MFQYVSKFLIQILPSVTATVIGGFIVHTWIMPRASTDTPRPAIVSNASPEAGGDAVAAGAPDAKPDAKPANIKGIAMPAKDSAPKDMAAKEAVSVTKSGEKPGEVKLRGASDVDTRHAAKPDSADKPAPADKAAVVDKPAMPAADKPKAAAIPAVSSDVAAVTPAVEEKRNASDLARSALERLRSGEQPRNDHSRTAEPAKVEIRTSEPPRTQPQPVVEPVHAVAEPQPASMPMGPPINIRAPRYSEAVIGEDTRSDETRMVPPGEIPTVHRTAESQDGRTTIADDFVSATRSMLRAVLPK